MRDNFKKYVEDHSEELEHSFDVDKGWQQFDMQRITRTSKVKIWMVAASVALLLSVSASWILMNGIQPRELSEWEEVELFYQSQIDNMTLLVRDHSSDKDLLGDLEEMDRAFSELKADLHDDAANEEVIEAMMNHYRLKLRILEKMLDDIREDNEKEKDIPLL